MHRIKRMGHKEGTALHRLKCIYCNAKKRMYKINLYRTMQFDTIHMKDIQFLAVIAAL